MEQADSTVKPPKATTAQKQPKLRLFFPDAGASQLQVHTSMKSEKAAADSKVNIKSTAKEKGKSTGNIFQDAKQNPGKYIVLMVQNKDTSKELPPVPEGERENRYLYCDQCSFSTTTRSYWKVHNSWQCLFLTVVERIKCPGDGCGQLFIREHNFKDHINIHLGVSKYKCDKCSQAFVHQNQLARHKRNC